MFLMPPLKSHLPPTLSPPRPFDRMACELGTRSLPRAALDQACGPPMPHGIGAGQGAALGAQGKGQRTGSEAAQPIPHLSTLQKSPGELRGSKNK